MKTLPRLLPAVRALSPADLGSLALWAVTLAALELWGGEAQTDVGDTLGVLTLASLVSLTSLGYRTGRLRWIAFVPRAGRRLRSRWRRMVPDIGIDLRREPPIPPGTPPLARGLLWAALLTTVAVLPFQAELPHALRDTLVPISYVGYLALLATLWAALATGGLFSLLLGLFWIHDRFVEHRSRSKRTGRLQGRNLEPLAHSSVVVAIAAGVLFAPGWLAPVIAMTLGGLTLFVHVPSVDPPLVLLWRSRGRSQVRSIGWRASMTAQILFSLSLVLLLTLVSGGGRLFLDAAGSTGGSLRLTPVLGDMFSWAACAGLGVLFAQAIRANRAARAFGRAASSPPCLRIGQGPDGAEREGLRARLAASGWSVSFEDEPAVPEALRVTLVPEEPDPFDAFFVKGPRQVTEAALLDPARRAQWERAQELQLRRRLTKGIRAALNQARRRQFSRGHGFWIAPQYWFVTGLSRDQVEEGPTAGGDYLFEQILGSPWEHLIPWASRSWFHRICRNLEVDLIFLEDGLDWRRFRRVLDVMFEVHDVHGGRERLEERHLGGITGVRAVLHELELGQPFHKKGYPEPDYEDLARARVLQVFRDRGGEDETVETPSGVEGQPVLVPA